MPPVPPAEDRADPALSTLLRAEPPQSVLTLSQEARAELVRVIAHARQHQAEQLAASYDASLRHVPAPVRRLVRKVLTG